jgi:trk system potassium uptake protein
MENERTVILRRVHLFLIMLAMMFIFVSSTRYGAIFSLLLPIARVWTILLMVFMWITLLHLVGTRDTTWFLWLKRNVFLILWTTVSTSYGMTVLLPKLHLLAHHKTFYAMILLQSTLFYVNQLKRGQLGRYVGLLLQKPAHTTVVSYLSLMFIFAILLLLPIAQSNYYTQGISSLNALFIAVSALCVTGLSPVDVSKVFSPIGLAIILVAVQFGGIGIALLGSIMLYVKRSVGLSGRTLLAYSFSDDAVSDVGKVAMRVLMLTFAIEAVGAIYLAIYFLNHDYQIVPALAHGIFFSVSAFCNAGFSLFENGTLDPVRFDMRFLFMINVLITCGVLGFNFMFYEGARLKRRLRKIFRRNKALPSGMENSSAVNGTLILWSGYGSLIAILVIFFLFYALEHHYSIRELSTSEQYIESFFLAVDAKTAGFMSRDFTTMRYATHLLFMITMFIGGSSGGTAGGIKINTIFVIFAGFKAFVSQRPLAKIGKLSISWYDVRRANFLLISGVSVAVLATFLLSVSEKNQDAQAIVWEVISALGTVGTSLNYTAELSVFGRIVIMSVMIVGRMGALTLFSLVQERSFKKEPSYPLGNIYIG